MTSDFYAPRFEVRISGLTLAADVASQTVALTVETDLDLAGSFSLSLRNPDNMLLDSALFDLGKTVEIHVGYGDQLSPAFLGEIAAIEPTFPQDGPPMVRVSGYDKSYKMRHNQPEPTDYSFANDSIVAARIAVENGLIPLVDPTPGLEETLPRSGSDMAFLKSRARKYFFDVYVEWDRLHFQFPRPQSAAHVLEWGRNLSQFSPRISSTGLAGINVLRDYNQELAQTIYGIATSLDFDAVDLEERLGSSALDLLATLVRKGIHSGGPVKNPLDAMAVAKALLADLLEGMYEGSGSCVGIPELSAGSYIRIAGVGKRFSGTYRLRKVTHTIDDSGYRTHFDITQRAHSSLMGLVRKHIAEKPPSDAADKFGGVMLAEVVDDNEMASGRSSLGRVRVKFPSLSSDLTSAWAPCARPMAGDDAGFYALPKPGDQVLVAFERGDLTSPYVLGSLWNMVAQPPASNLDGTNSLTVLKTRAGHHITLDDTKGAETVLIESKAGAKVTLANDGSVTIQANNEVTVTGKKLTLTANEDINLTAIGDINLKGASVNVTGNEKVDLTVRAESGPSTSLQVTSDHVDVS
jgi:phage protein D/phage baseplate assembly protein gpV